MRCVFGILLFSSIFICTCTSYHALPDAGSDADAADGQDGGGSCIDAYPGQVIITEIMIQPAGFDPPAGCYVELFNTSIETLHMEGWILEDGAGGVAELELPERVDFPPESHVVLAFDDDPEALALLEPALVIDGLNPGSGKLSITAGETLIDEVDFSGPEWPFVIGASISLDSRKYNCMYNNDPANWCASTDFFGQGERGSPGQGNPPCPVDSECGDGKAEGQEECDDGQNGDDEDGCRDDCRFTCSQAELDCEDEPGDCHAAHCVPNEIGRVCESEVDDEDLPDDDNPCTQDTCRAGVPGHLDFVDGFPCDNGGGEVGDYCVDVICIEPVCGDDVRGPLEGCDDGNRISGDGCSAACVLEECGDGKNDAGEDCDDGADGDDADGCRDDCHYSCVIADLDCVDATGDCQKPVCVPNAVGQVCGLTPNVDDLPDDDNPCTADLCDESGQPFNPPLADGTACDNAAGKVHDYCVAGLCCDPVCGDGVVGPSEDCEDEDLDPCDGCLPDCTARENTCGDGFFCPGDEACDDSNDVPGDGCSADCQLEDSPCPADMVYVDADPEMGVTAPFCMDRYEASRPDATFLSIGVDRSMATSRPNAIPWHVSYMDATAFDEFQLACENAGKHLCTEEEWNSVCVGPGRTTYAYGNGWDRERCNCVNTFCDDYCDEYGIEDCDDSDRCGYNYYCFHVMPTGQYPECVDAYGAYDVAGNVWEIVVSQDDPYGRGWEVRGGAFNCASPAARLACYYNAGWAALYAGFRCCKPID
ncbi:MAG: SUMF1/EgtB/PvdO family nonheme iron enzyme [Deltaproteobacteria bacterium]|nr:SUMF1/EgtB/PvdO family nonheme iron enzyme [Deltaproteobacteria bacterium]